jgi:SlyX protein
MADPEAIAGRVTELESRYTLESDLLQQLSDVVFSQQKELSALARRVAALERRLANVSAEVEQRDPDEEPPPHY